MEAKIQGTQKQQNALLCTCKYVVGYMYNELHIHVQLIYIKALCAKILDEKIIQVI